jgi:hypothetical protein
MSEQKQNQNEAYESGADVPAPWEENVQTPAENLPAPPEGTVWKELNPELGSVEELNGLYAVVEYIEEFFEPFGEGQKGSDAVHLYEYESGETRFYPVTATLKPLKQAVGRWIYAEYRGEGTARRTGNPFHRVSLKMAQPIASQNEPVQAQIEEGDAE